MIGSHVLPLVDVTVLALGWLAAGVLAPFFLASALRKRRLLQPLGWIAIVLALVLAVDAVVVEREEIEYMGGADVFAVIVFCGPLLLTGILGVGMARRARLRDLLPSHP